MSEEDGSDFAALLGSFGTHVDVSKRARAGRMASMPGTEKDPAPQANDECGVACHALAQTKDYIFTTYFRR